MCIVGLGLQITDKAPFLFTECTTLRIEPNAIAITTAMLGENISKANCMAIKDTHTVAAKS